MSKSARNFSDSNDGKSTSNLTEFMSFKDFLRASAVGLAVVSGSPSNAFGQIQASSVVSSEDEYQKVLNAIRAVETGGVKNPNDAVGDKGKALGPYQIWKSYWKDAVEFDKSIGGKYEDVKNKEYAEKVIRAYWKRYAPKNPTVEQLAALHNGGPKAIEAKNWSKTEKYRAKVLKHLK